MGENILLPSETELYISSIKISKIEEIGTISWLEWHQRLQKLQQQAFLEAKNLKEETVQEFFVSYKKIDFLVHEMLTISIWRKKVLPKLLKINPKPENILLYSILFHEATCVGLLEIILYHNDSIQTLGDSVLDVVDYIHESVTKLIAFKQQLEKDPTYFCETNVEDLSEDFERQRVNILFEIGLRSISIFYHLITNIEHLSFSAISRLIKTKDTPMLLVQLLIEKPWLRKKSKQNKTVMELFTNGQWLESNNYEKIVNYEAQIWLSLRQLFLNEECSRFYELTDFRRQQFLRLNSYLTDNLLDQVSALIDLKYWLAHLSITNSSTFGDSKSEILLEIIPQIKENILKSVKNWEKLIQKQSENFKSYDKDKIKHVACILNETYNLDIYTDQVNETNQICAACGLSNQSLKTCSRCKQDWYCSRQCQVKHWPQHKLKCNT